MKHVTLAGICLVFLGVQPARPDTPVYSRDIAPLFAMKCNGCHGAPEYGHWSAAEGKLDTTNYPSLRRGGGRGPGVTPGATDRSSVMMDLYTLRAPQFAPRHPDWAAGETIQLRDWIRAGAPFDSEPVPRQCVDVSSVPTSKLYFRTDYPVNVHFRAWAPGYVSMRISNPSRDLVRTYSKALDWGAYRGLSTWDDFILSKQDGLPGSVDLRICIQYSTRPSGFAVYLGDYDSANEGSGMQVQALDPVEAKRGERVYVTAWHTGSGKARFEIRELAGKVLFTENTDVPRGVSRHAWTVPPDLAAPGDYIASVQTTYPQAETARLFVLFHVAR